MAQNDNNQELLELVGLIQQLISHQIENNNNLNEAAKESLTVATECIEQAYNIQRKPASDSLVKIYKTHKQQQQQSADGTAGMPRDPSQLLTNLASTIFSQVGGGLAAAATGASNPNSGEGQQQQSSTATATQSATPADRRPTAPPKQRKRASEAEKMAAESFKNQGNDYMKQDKYKEAYDCYSQAIEIDDNNAIYYSNRAAASSKLGNHQSALNDCKEAIEIDPNYSKAYGRMGLSYASLENHVEAKRAYDKAVELDPTNESYQNNKRIAEDMIREQQGVGGGVGGGQQAGANVMGMLRSMMSNPQVMSMAMQSLQDPRIQGMFGVGSQNNNNQQQQQQQANNDQQQSASPTSDSQQQQSATRAPGGQQSANTQPGEQPTSGNGDQSQFNPADLLNLTSRLANNANIDLVGAGAQILSSIQQNNPDLVDNMRRMMSQAFMNPNGRAPGGNQGNDNPPPGYS